MVTPVVRFQTEMVPSLDPEAKMVSVWLKARLVTEPVTWRVAMTFGEDELRQS